MERFFQLSEEIGALLVASRTRLVTAESCTGGGISYALTGVPGSSNWFERGFVTYSNAAKSAQLCVPDSMLNTEGAVSEATALAMASGAKDVAKADYSIAVTGIAGPDGGTPDKPVGTVWIAWGQPAADPIALKFHFSGDRQSVREASIQAALRGLKALLMDRPLDAKTLNNFAT